MRTPITEGLDIRSLTVAAAAKLLKVAPQTIRAHIRRGLPRSSPCFAGNSMMG